MKRLKDLYPGDKVRETRSGILFTVAGLSPYGGDGVCLITDQVIAQGAMDAPEPEAPEENFAVTGNNRYVLSNLHQWLNADGMDWYIPSHAFDTPPTEENLALRPTLFDPIRHNAYAHQPGFLSRFSPAFRRSLRSSRIPCALPDGSGVEYTDALVFSPSAAEIGLDTGTSPEGTRFPLFADFRMRYAAPSEACLADGAWQPAFFQRDRTFWYWLRTPNPTTPGFFAYAHFVNPYSYKFACSPWMGIRPMLAIDGTAPTESDGGSLGEYRLVEVSI